MEHDIRIRLAEDRDVPEIVALLNVCLGDVPFTKTVEYWKWKHQDNPFGQSAVLLAEDHGSIVGVRSFMRWHWWHKGKIIRSVRGVDTAMMPEYRGKGLFGELTLKLMEKSRQEGESFLFSTPNPGSGRAYAKLGWRRTRLPVRIRIVKPLSLLRNGVIKGPAVSAENEMENEPAEKYVRHPDFERLVATNRKFYDSKVIAAHNAASLLWRYARVPVENYYGAGIEDDGLRAVCFYRLKVSRLGKELRITDVFLESRSWLPGFKKKIDSVIKANEIDYVTCGSFAAYDVLGNRSVQTALLGPKVTVHNILLNDPHPFIKFSSWSPMLGDLELF